MNRRQKLCRSVVAAGLCLCLTTQVGCDRIVSALSGSIININLPLGLNGAPGLLNPFGLTQSLFVSLFGVNTTTGDGDGGGDAPAGGVDPGTLVGGLNGGGGGPPQ